MPRVTPRSRRLRFLRSILRLNLALTVSQVIRDAIAESYIDLDNSSDMDSDNMDDSDSSDDSSDDEGLFDTDLSSEYIEAVFLVRGGKSRGRAKPFNDAMGDPSSLKTRLEICAYEFFIENCSEIAEIAEILAIAKFGHKSKWGVGLVLLLTKMVGHLANQMRCLFDQNFIPNFKFNFAAILILWLGNLGV